MSAGLSFYSSSLQACDRGDPSRTRTASSGSEWSLPAGPEHQAVAPAEPEQQRRTQTASSGSASRRSEWSLLDLNCKREIPVVPAGPNTKIECQIECQNRCQIGCQNRCQIESQKEWQIERENICHNIYIYVHKTIILIFFLMFMYCIYIYIYYLSIYLSRYIFI